MTLRYNPKNFVPVLHLMPERRESGTSAYLHAYFNWIAPTDSTTNPEIRSWQGHEDYSKRRYANLRLRAIVNHASLPEEGHNPGEISFGWDIQYYDCPNRMGYDELHCRHQTMTPIARRIMKARTEGTFPDSFGGFVHLIADAANIDFIVIPSQRQSGLTAGSPWSLAFLPSNDAIAAVDALCIALQQECEAAYEAQQRQQASH